MPDAASAAAEAAPSRDGGTAAATLLDRLLPSFDFRAAYAIDVDAPAPTVIAAAEAYRLDRSPVVRLLFRLRGLGAAPKTLRSSLQGGGFTLLAEEAGREVVFGIAGRFWALNEMGNTVALPDPRAFVAFDRPGFAKAAVNLRGEALNDRCTRLVTETRVCCCDAAARRSFALYWTLIGPFSGWIRRIMLRGMRRDALELARRRALHDAREKSAAAPADAPTA